MENTIAHNNKYDWCPQCGYGWSCEDGLHGVDQVPDTTPGSTAARRRWVDSYVSSEVNKLQTPFQEGHLQNSNHRTQRQQRESDGLLAKSKQAQEKLRKKDAVISWAAEVIQVDDVFEISETSLWNNMGMKATDCLGQYDAAAALAAAFEAQAQRPDRSKKTFTQINRRNASLREFAALTKEISSLSKLELEAQAARREEAQIAAEFAHRSKSESQRHERIATAEKERRLTNISSRRITRCVPGAASYTIP